MSDPYEVPVTSNEPAGRPTPSLFDGMRRMVLASIGAVAITRDEIEGVVNKLVERGELAQKEGETLTNELRQRVRLTRENAETFNQDVARQVETGVEQFLNRLNIPSKRDIDDLSTKIAQLNARVEELRRAEDTKPE